MVAQATTERQETAQVFRASVMQAELERGLKAIQGRTVRKSDPSHMRHILICAEDAHVSLTTISEGLTQTASIGARVERPGVVVTDGDILRDLVPLLESQRIDLELKNEVDTRWGTPKRYHGSASDPRVRMRCGANASYLMSRPPFDFPAPLQMRDDEKLTTMDVEEFEALTSAARGIKKGLSRVTFGDLTLRVDAQDLARVWRNMTRFQPPIRYRKDQPAFYPDSLTVGYRQTTAYTFEAAQNGLLWITSGSYTAILDTLTVV